jgi:hypothetical protein
VIISHELPRVEPMPFDLDTKSLRARETERAGALGGACLYLHAGLVTPVMVRPLDEMDSTGTLTAMGFTNCI